MITYHDPCHLRKSLGVFAPPRVLLQGDTRFRFEEMAEAEACCGCGGSFSLEYYELSSAVGARKRAAILAPARKWWPPPVRPVCCSSPIYYRKVDDPVRVKHVIELFAERLPG